MTTCSGEGQEQSVQDNDVLQVEDENDDDVLWVGDEGDVLQVENEDDNLYSR